MHAEMILILFTTLFFAQIILFLWKKKHIKSFNVSFLLQHFVTNKFEISNSLKIGFLEPETSKFLNVRKCVRYEECPKIS